MTDLESFEGSPVRFVGTPEKPEWVAADIVSVLYPEAPREDYPKYWSNVPLDWKGRKKLPTPGGEQEMVTVYESGFYYLLTRSNSPKAIPFQRWIFEEVLPTIRKKGYYSADQQRHVLPALEARKERLEIIQIGMDLLGQLGGIDERTETQFKDLVRDIVLADKLQQPALSSGEQKRLEYPISDRLMDLGYGVQPGGVLKAIGQIASNLYKARYGERPPQREQFVDGTTRLVRLYSSDDLDIVDQAIKQKLGDPPK